MRILHLTTHLNRGGISKYIHLVGSQLIKKGHHVYVASSGGEMEEELKEDGFRLITLPIRTKSELSPKIYIALPELIRWIRDEKIELLHAHTRITQVMATWVQVVTRKPFITTSHGFYKPRLGRRLLPAWGEQVIAISDPVATHLRDTFHVPSERIRLVYNGVDLKALVSRFYEHDPRETRKEYKLPEDAFVVGTIARLVPDKGHEYLIRAVKVLESQIPNIALIVVGEGRHRKSLEQLVKKLKLGMRVHFTGNVKDISRPLAGIDIFVLPAVWREGFGLSIVEAMACRKPVVVTNIWALNTLIDDGINGILVEPRNVEGLTRAIQRLFNEPEFRRKIGDAGQKVAEIRFSLGRMVEELEGIYEEVLKG